MERERTVIVELASPHAAIAAATRLRELGYSEVEAYTPFPVPELEEALGVRRSKLPWAVLAAGLAGMTLSFLVLAWTNAVDYRLDVGGRPYLSLPTDIPIMFETTVLFAGTAAFFAALVLSGLPRLHHAVFELEGFERTTLDRFWLVMRSVADDVAVEELVLLSEELLPLGAIAVRREPRRSEELVE